MEELKEIREDQGTTTALFQERLKYSLIRKYIKEGKVYKALVHIETFSGIPPYVILRESDVDFRHYNRCLGGYDDLTEKEVERIFNWIKKYFGL